MSAEPTDAAARFSPAALNAMARAMDSLEQGHLWLDPDYCVLGYNRAYELLLGIRNANVYGFHSLVLIQSLAFTPIAYLNFVGMMRAFDASIEEAATDLGSNWWHRLRRVILPLLAPGDAMDIV